MQTERRLVPLSDGRVIDVLLAWPDNGIALVINEGTPIGLGIYLPTADAAVERGMRVIMVARPGYERSTPLLGRRIGDIAADVAAVLDDLGAGTFVTYGASGGAPHALAGLLSDVDKAALTGEYASTVAGLFRGAVRHGRPANWVGWQRAVD